MFSENNFNFHKKSLSPFDITIFEDNFKLKVHIDEFDCVFLIMYISYFLAFCTIVGDILFSPIILMPF